MHHQSSDIGAPQTSANIFPRVKIIIGANRNPTLRIVVVRTDAWSTWNKRNFISHPTKLASDYWQWAEQNRIFAVKMDSFRLSSAMLRRFQLLCARNLLEVFFFLFLFFYRINPFYCDASSIAGNTVLFYDKKKTWAEFPILVDKSAYHVRNIYSIAGVWLSVVGGLNKEKITQSARLRSH